MDWVFVMWITIGSGSQSTQKMTELQCKAAIAELDSEKLAIAALGTGVATFLGTPSSANLLAAVTDETGTGALVFANTPTLVTPALGVANGTSLALGGATIGTDALAVTGSSAISGVNLALANRTAPIAVGSLPAAAAGNAGERRMVNDSNATMTAGIGAVVAAGGANVVPVYSDGTDWRIG